jgi:hypothetical protein
MVAAPLLSTVLRDGHRGWGASALADENGPIEVSCAPIRGSSLSPRHHPCASEGHRFGSWLIPYQAKAEERVTALVHYRHPFNRAAAAAMSASGPQ